MSDRKKLRDRLREWIEAIEQALTPPPRRVPVPVRPADRR